MARKNILIVEDEADMADLVATRLKREGFNVDIAPDGYEAMRKIRLGQWDLVLLDVMLPGMSGIDVACELRNDTRTSDIPVIMMTARSEESDIVVALRLGADDYITKPFGMSVLVARVQAMLRRVRRDGRETGGSIKAGPVDIDTRKHDVTLDGRRLQLTLTEYRLLVALANARGAILSRNQLIDQAMGVDTIVTDRTIDVHMASLRKKLERARGIIRTVRGIGYRLDVESQGDDPA